MNDDFVHLLAKSTLTPDRPQEHESLNGHVVSVVDAARDALDSLALSPAWHEVVDAAVVRGALLHDLGKANDQFQRLVRGKQPALVVVRD